MCFLKHFDLLYYLLIYLCNFNNLLATTDISRLHALLLLVRIY